MPGRKPSVVRKLFSPVASVGKVKKMACHFCKTTVADNGKRMKDHILICKKCPPDVMMKYCAYAAHSSGHSFESCNPLMPSSAAGPSNTQTDDSSSIVTVSSGKSLTSVKLGRLDSYTDRITPDQQNEIDSLLARAIFASGAPLSLTENTYWQSAFNKIRPAYSLPSRYKLTNTLLYAEYARVSTTVNEEIASAQSLALICDGWSNVRNESIINFVVTTPKPVFYKSIAPGATSHTGEFLATSMQIINEIGSEKFIGIVTDNAANMRNAWIRIQEVYPHVVCYGCAAHGIQLLLGDICKLQSAADILQKAKSIVKEVNNRQRLRAMLSSHSKAVQCTQSLKMPLQHVGDQELSVWTAYWPTN